MRVVITYKLPGVGRVEWHQGTGLLTIFSEGGERLGGIPGLAWTRDEAEQLIAKEFGSALEVVSIYYVFRS